MPALVGEPPQQQEDEEKAPNLQNQNRENPFFENAVVHQYGAPNPWELLEEFKTLEYNIQNWYNILKKFKNFKTKFIYLILTFQNN